MSTKAEEIAELQALIDAMPDGDDSEAVDAYETANPNANEVVEVSYRRVKNKHYHGVKHELICEECELTFYRHLPAKYDGRICGSNCASIVIEKARDILGTLLSAPAIEALSPALLDIAPQHLQERGSDPRLLPGGADEPVDPAYPEAPEAPVAPKTLAEIIADKLRKQ